MTIMGVMSYTLFHIDSALFEQMYNIADMDYRVAILFALSVLGLCSLIITISAVNSESMNRNLREKNKLLEQQYKDLNESFNACAVINETILGLVDRSVKEHLAKQYGKLTHENDE
jgi:uncharacterized membrane-anchored protein YhcB (DUF1043 family)